jgi:hypothetical protein
MDYLRWRLPADGISLVRQLPDGSRVPLRVEDISTVPLDDIRLMYGAAITISAESGLKAGAEKTRGPKRRRELAIKEEAEAVIASGKFTLTELKSASRDCLQTLFRADHRTVKKALTLIRETD